MLRLTIATAMALSLSLAVLAPASAQDTAPPAADKSAHAQEVLKQARAALGDEAKLKALQSLTASGTSRRTFGERQVENEVEIDILLPDKIKRIDNSQFGSNTTALNGTQVWTEFAAAAGGFPGGGGDGGGGGGRGGAPGGGGGGGQMSAQAQAMIQQLQRGELTRLMLGLLLTPPAGVNLEFTYGGEAKAPDGMTADIIDAKGEGFTARLFLDQKTHHLLMIGFKSRQFRGRPGGARAGGPGGAGGAPAAGQGAGRGAGAGQGAGQGTGQGTGQGAGQAAGQGAGGGAGAGQQAQMTPEEREKRMRDAMERAPEVDVRLAFADYKTVNGISLPHRIVRSEGGTPTEETTISKYKINPSLKADKFEKKEKK